MLANVDELLDTIPFRLLQAGELEEGISPDIFMETLSTTSGTKPLVTKFSLKKQ
jgi:hypothetical protein